MARRDDLPDPRMDALRATPPRSFAGARETLAKALAGEGKPDLAREVRAIKKPTVPVFAVNLLARRERERVRGVLDAAGELAELQRRALAGEGGSLASAAGRFTEAIEDAVAAARRAAEAAGQPLSPAAANRVRATLRALAAGTEDARLRLSEGRVEEEAAESGFDPLQAMAGASRPQAARGRAPAGGGARKAKAAEARRAAEVRRRVAAARTALRRAEAKAEKLRGRAEAARRAADRAAAESGEAERELALRRAEARSAALDERGGA